MYYIGQVVLLKESKYPAILLKYKKEDDVWRVILLNRNKKLKTVDVEEIDPLFEGDATKTERKIFHGKFSTFRLFHKGLSKDDFTNTIINEYLTSVNKSIISKELETRIVKS